MLASSAASNSHYDQEQQQAVAFPCVAECQRVSNGGDERQR